jgi:hypothetical protein
MRWVDDVMEEILVACKWTLQRRQHELAAGVLEGHTHIVLEVWVCARSNEVSHGLHVEFVGDRGKVKRSPSVLQQKKK